MGKVLSHLKNRGIGVNYCWIYRPSKLQLYFIESHLGQLKQVHENSSKLDRTIFWKPLSKELSGKVLKFFALPTLKWRSCKVSVNFNWNYVFMANIFKLRKYQTFGLFMELYMVYWKYIIWAKSDLPIMNLVCEKFWFTINGLLKMLFFSKLYCFTNIFDLHTFDNETTIVIVKMDFVSLFFLNERNITTSLLIIHLK